MSTRLHAELFPGGILIEREDYERTATEVSSLNSRILYQAVFQTPEYKRPVTS